MRAGRAQRARPPAGTAWPRALIAAALAGGCLAIAADRTVQGRVILAALQRFLLFYSGVFALVALTAAVAAGLIATDRLVMTPPGRVVSQAVHRALALAALGFLASHILLEILAHRSRVVDAVVPFLASGRTLYLGLGTLASDLLLLVAVTSVARRRFATRRPGTWRVMHVTAYLAWPLAIVHGLLSGRHAKPYVDWSYGACLALVALAVVIRLLAVARGRSEVAAYPGPGQAAPGPPAAALAARPQAAWLPGQPPPRRALPSGSSRGTARYRTGHGGAPRASGDR